jgi:hypothetical protein
LVGSVYLPTTPFLITPFALLPWSYAHILWLSITFGLLIFASFLVLDLAADHAPGVSLFLICMMLVNTECLFSSGNPAGIALSLCFVAVWCFLRARHALVGVICLALSLAIKPRDSGFVWLYFLLAGGVLRKRAIQSFVVTSILSVPAILWVIRLAPNRIQELKFNLVAAAHGGLSGPASLSGSIHGLPVIVDLQAVTCIFWRDPHSYNIASYLVCGAVLLTLSIAILRSRSSPARARLAIAAIAALTMLPDYHRSYDLTLLLLVVPACAVLWSERGLIGWCALFVTSIGAFLTGDLPLAILGHFTRGLQLSTATLSGRILTVALDRPVAPILLLICLFYLSVYLMRVSGKAAAEELEILPNTSIMTATD